MSDDKNIVDSNGNIYDRTLGGSYRQRQGTFGPERDTDAFGRPQVDRGPLGNARPATDALGRQATSDTGRPLYTSTPSGSGTRFPDLGHNIALGLTILVFWLAYMILRAVIRLLASLCRNHPKVGYPVVALVVIGISLLSILPIIPAFTSRSSSVDWVEPVRSASSTPTSATRPISVPVTLPTRLVVGNTDGDGVYMRNSPRMADRAQAWPDGTILVPTGRTATGDGRNWYEVRDPAGSLGWVPTQYVMPAQASP